jgi:methylated-DNA-[protein]-cysteine S-methyltransferase
MNELESGEIIVFATELGWMSLQMQGGAVTHLSFGHPSAAVALKAIAPGRVTKKKLGKAQRHVVERLKRYAKGEAVEFSDLQVNLGVLTKFQARVLRACREIPYGTTVSYGELARTAGAPGAARAVGSCMAGNRVPLIIPCHRVVRAGGDIGSYSAPGGSATKRRLLKMETSFR